MIGLLQKVCEEVLDAVFPAVCAGCGRSGSYVCQRCTLFLTEAEPVCPACLQESFAGQAHAHCSREGLDGLVSVWEYEGVVKSLLKGIKEGGVGHAAGQAMELGFHRLAAGGERYTPFFETLLAGESAVTFVPMFTRREQRQGFNHAFLIARALAEASGKRPLSLLRKLHDISLREEWDRGKRREILQGAFVLEGSFGAFPREVVVADDLWRSGATLQEASRLLKRAGAEKVWGFTLAKVP